jgi:hypothetical protein
MYIQTAGFADKKCNTNEPDSSPKVKGQKYQGPENGMDKLNCQVFRLCDYHTFESYSEYHLSCLMLSIVIEYPE